MPYTKQCGKILNVKTGNIIKRMRFACWISKATDTHSEYEMRIASPQWAGHVARMGEERGVYRVLVGKPEVRRPLGRPRRRWWIILGWTSRKWDVGIWTGLGWLRIETGGGRL